LEYSFNQVTELSSLYNPMLRNFEDGNNFDDQWQRGFFKNFCLEYSYIHVSSSLT